MLTDKLCSPSYEEGGEPNTVDQIQSYGMGTKRQLSSIMHDFITSVYFDFGKRDKLPNFSNDITSYYVDHTIRYKGCVWAEAVTNQ